MRFFLLPQKLLTDVALAELEWFLTDRRGTQVTSGWSPSSTLNRDGWLFDRVVYDNAQLDLPAEVRDLFLRHGTGWLEAQIDRDNTAIFWPVIWHHHGPDGAVVQERTVFNLARLAGWFDSPYRHAPTAHAHMAALAKGQRLAPPPLKR